jgi:predicted lipoprotein with Yx(FWY)xxD motif
MNRLFTIRRAIAIAALTAAASASIMIGSTPAGAQSTTTAAAKKLKLTVADSKLGSIIVDDKGFSLYMFAPDRYNVSVCDGQCLTAWPPVMMPAGSSLSDVDLSGGLRKSKLGYALREDGSRQLTYNGWALYYWFRDTKAGDVNGQWVGSVWWVLSEEGIPNTKRVS